MSRWSAARISRRCLVVLLRRSFHRRTTSPRVESRWPMLSLKANIERSNRKALKQVSVNVTVVDLSSGRQSWHGDFMSRTSDGFLPSERIQLKLLDNLTAPRHGELQ